MEIAPRFTGYIQKLAVFPDGTYAIAATPAHPSVPEAKVMFAGWQPSLPTIANKKTKKTLSPPTRHFEIKLAGKPPHEIAELALGHYRSVLEQAQSKFVLLRAD